PLVQLRLRDGPQILVAVPALKLNVAHAGAQTRRTKYAVGGGVSGHVHSDLVLGNELFDHVGIDRGEELEVDAVAGMEEEKADVVTQPREEHVLPDLGRLQQTAVDLDAIGRRAVNQIDAAPIGRDIPELLLRSLEPLVILVAEA